MEKSIHSHLFAALVSTREQRLAFMATPEQQQFDETAAGIEKEIENPDTLTDALIPRIAELKVSAIADRDNSSRVEELNDILNKKMDLQREITETEKKTSDTNADWKKITEDIKSTDAVKRDAAIEAAKTLIVDSRARMNELSVGILSLDDLEPRLLAKVTVKAIAAHNKNIQNVQDLDPENTITFVPAPNIGEQAAKDALQAIKDRGAQFLSTELNDALNTIKNANGPGAKKLANDKLDALVKNRREEIYSQISIATDTVTPYVNAEQQVAALIGQLKEMTDEIDAVKGPTVAPATAVVDPAAPAVAPATAPDTAPATAPSTTPTTAPATPNVIPTASPEEVTKQVEAVKNAIISGDKAAIEKSLEDFNKLPSTKEKQDRVDAINKALVAAGHDKTHAALDTGDKIVVVPGSPKAPETAVAPSEPEKTQLQILIDLFEKILKFFREDRIAGGDLGILKSELESIDEQIAKLKKDNPDFSTKPDILKQIEDLDRQRNELKLTIDRGTKVSNRVVRDANGFIRNSETPLFVRVAQDRDGNAYLLCTKNTPEAQGHMRYMTGRLQQVHPELRLNQRAGVDQRVYFNVYGDVNINSKNNNSRTINNTNTINGDNNTASNTADGSQNGNNEALGGFGTANEGTAKNRANRSPNVTAEQVVTPAPTVEPLRPQLVDTPPPTGNLPGLS